MPRAMPFGCPIPAGARWLDLAAGLAPTCQRGGSAPPRGHPGWKHPPAGALVLSLRRSRAKASGTISNYAIPSAFLDATVQERVNFYLGYGHCSTA